MTLSRSRSVVACFTFDCGRPHAPTTANPTTISRILRIFSRILRSFATPNGVVKVISRLPEIAPRWNRG